MILTVNHISRWISIIITGPHTDIVVTNACIDMTCKLCHTAHYPLSYKRVSRKFTKGSIHTRRAERAHTQEPAQSRSDGWERCISTGRKGYCRRLSCLYAKVSEHCSKERLAQTLYQTQCDVSAFHGPEERVCLASQAVLSTVPEWGRISFAFMSLTAKNPDLLSHAWIQLSATKRTPGIEETDEVARPGTVRRHGRPLRSRDERDHVSHGLPFRAWLPRQFFRHLVRMSSDRGTARGRFRVAHPCTRELREDDACPLWREADADFVRQAKLLSLR